LLTAHRENVATPTTADAGLEVQVRVPVPGLVEMVNVMASLEATGTLEAFSTATLGCADRGWPGAPLPGSMVKTR
jgi:hypothetical protein